MTEEKGEIGAVQTPRHVLLNLIKLNHCTLNLWLMLDRNVMGIETTKYIKITARLWSG